ncbi:putative cytochrome P450 E-class, group I [Triangularia setosa]|uniref:Cytochrome P450 E-class, group I n=1 Tax=Triangularia setosa TaxID=2587417 RepID=A0AAN6W5N4_9PEZI|nr:putative cytochrome P450 E-class, group I [Podospora setosa]
MNSARTEYRRSSWYTPLRLDPWGENLFVCTSNAAHTALRSKLANGYNAKEVPTLESDIEYIINKLIAHIQKGCLSPPEGEGPTRKVDFAVVSQFFTLDVITKVAYGREFGYLDRNEDMFSWIKTINDQAAWLGIMSDWPIIGKIFTNKYVLGLIGPEKKPGKGIGGIMKMAEEIVAERFAPGAEKDRRDMLGAFVRHGVTQRECEVEVPFQIIAGSDTTAVAVRGVLMYLAACRRVYSRLQREIDEGVREGRISSPIRNEEGKGFELLQAVIYETLRMQPPIVGLLLKEVPPQGDYINGQFIPGGTRVGQNAWTIQRDKVLFGEDSDVFRPERWLTADPVRKKMMTDTTEMIFGYGRWVCLGKPMAFMELNKVIVELLRRFDFELADPKSGIKEKEYGLLIQRGLWMRITERFPDKVEN